MWAGFIRFKSLIIPILSSTKMGSGSKHQRAETSNQRCN